ARALRDVHGLVGGVQQVAEPAAPCVADGEADAGGDRERLSVEMQRLGKRGGNLGGTLCCGRGVHGTEPYGELVAVQAKGGLAAAHRLPQPGGDGDEQFVADAMPERVVDLLEPVEVEQQHTDGGTPAGSAGSSLEQLTTRQAGEAVVRGAPPPVP